MPFTDLQAQRGDTVDFPATRLRAVTPSDTLDLDFIPKALYIGTGGSISIIALEDSAPITLTNVVAGTFIPVRAKFVRATGTTASGIVAFI